ncbi:hypothetical protein GGD83_004580 [Rhodoblastus sphagnicola]|uniref:hypothetical protein n=1 Tax=Rhodoblastus sphagnicola TaxID=333368 RepID=UPI0017D0E3C6|nr:hypothetical protein [Rhodoblastus sphagnicola]MBB4200751.1 hypothetical protein [Rhodoblastus sphagnicola]
MTALSAPTSFDYSRWRHGGWYVGNVRYPSGACGCVSRNYVDRKWRIACDPRPFETQPTFRTRDAAALGEWHLIQEIADAGGEAAYLATLKTKGATHVQPAA